MGYCMKHAQRLFCVFAYSDASSFFAQSQRAAGSRFKSHKGCSSITYLIRPAAERSELCPGLGRGW